MNRGKNLASVIICIVTFMAMLFSASYAYFTSSTSTANMANVKTALPIQTTIISDGNSCNLNLTFAQMNGEKNTEVPVASTSCRLDVKVNGNQGGYCLYDLTLADESSTQYTPSNGVGTAPNNFEFTGQVTYGSNGHNLPSDYQEVEYIQSDGNEYIDTGLKPTMNTYVKIKASMVSLNPTTQYLYGSKNATSGWNGYALLTYGTPTFWHDYGSLDQQSNFNVAVDIIYEMETYNGSLYIDDVQKLAPRSSSYTFNNNMYIFGVNGGSFTSPAKMRLYSFEMRDAYNGNLQRDFVPCYRKSDNAIGLYDLVSGNFFNKSGSGSFTKGKNVGYSSNLLKYPYVDTTKTSSSGVTFTDNGNGSITVNGTSTDYPTFTLNDDFNFESGKTYTFRNFGSDNNLLFVVAYVDGSGEMHYAGSWETGHSFTWNSTYTYYKTYLQVNPGDTVNNLTVYPMMVEGDQFPDTYEPYSTLTKETNINLLKGTILKDKKLVIQNTNVEVQDTYNLNINWYNLNLNQDSQLSKNYVISLKPTNIRC